MYHSHRKQPCTFVIVACWVGLSLITGCQTSSRFSEPPPFAVADIEPSDVPARFFSKMAPQFEALYSLVFHYRWMEFTAVGMASVDTKTRSLAVTCMTPLGVKMFDVICKDGVLEKAFVLPALGETQSRSRNQQVRI